ncbi:MAG: ATP-binding protein, partial [Spirochaetaceae bacterium]|nr:ATP-binding protein [Spirochaetaceae bacterium]
LRRDIARACVRQEERQGRKNARLTPAEIGVFCALGQKEEALFREILSYERMSGRAAHSILKTARTIADMADSGGIGEEHLLEAAQHRRWGDNPLEAACYS